MTIMTETTEYYDNHDNGKQPSLLFVTDNTNCLASDRAKDLDSSQVPTFEPFEQKNRAIKLEVTTREM